MSHVCQNIHGLFSGLPKFDFHFDAEAIPANGIYVVFEKGETAHRTERIVRVGTHSGDNRLPSTLQQHFVNERKDKSIFRKNIGRALLKRDKSDLLEKWEIDLTTAEAKWKYARVIDNGTLQRVERQVTEYIRSNFTFVVFSVEEKAQRLLWESKIIATVFQCQECHPSNEWLGLHSPKEKIRESGLWLVNELYQEPLSEEEYEALKLTIQGS